MSDLYNDVAILTRIETELGFTDGYLLGFWEDDKHLWTSQADFVECWHKLSLGRDGEWALQGYAKIIYQHEADFWNNSRWSYVEGEKVKLQRYLYNLQSKPLGKRNGGGG